MSEIWFYEAAAISYIWLAFIFSVLSYADIFNFSLNSTMYFKRNEHFDSSAQSAHNILGIQQNKICALHATFLFVNPVWLIFKLNNLFIDNMEISA